MNDKLTYQQAKRLREQSLTSTLADQLILGEGYGSAIAKTISLKTKAKITGIKQKFDPLNIAKILTGGSRLGPAIVGKMLGRSRKDIEFFAGRARPVTSRNRTVGALPGTGGEDVTGMSSVLNDILTFLHKSHDRDMVLREKENNLREGEKHEDERRHKKLLKTLSKINLAPSATPEKDEKGGMFGDLLEKMRQMIAQAIEDVKSMIEKAIEGFKWLKETSLFKWLASLASPFALIAAISAAIFGGTAMLQNAELQRLKDLGGEEALKLGEARQQQEIQGAGDVSSVGSAIMNAKEEGSSEKISKAIAKKQAVVEQLMNEQGFTKTGVDKYGAFQFQNKDGKSPSAELLKTAYNQADGLLKGSTTPETSKQGSTPPSTSPKIPEPVIQTPPSASVSTKTTENQNLNLQEKTTPPVSTTTNTNIVNKNKQPPRKISMPSVRNMEETFQRVIYNSTRVV